MSFYTYNNHSAYNNAYYKASLIKVIDINKANTIFYNYILYKPKLIIDNS